MKQLFRFWVVATLLLMTGCSKEYDDSALLDRVDDLENRVSKLEQLCQQMNTDISSLQTIVTALQSNDCVTGVTPITENGNTIGYTISFAKAQSITIYHGKDGQDGGDSDFVPAIGVKQDSDGVYYWTLDGEWLLDDSENKVKAVGIDGKDGQDGTNGTDGEDGKDGITPQLKIENDYWYVSYDNGATWVQLGKATGNDGKDGQDGANGTDGIDGKSFFQDVTQDDNNVYFTLADGTVITVPKGLALSIAFDEADLVVMSPNSTRNIGYTVTSATESVTVEVTSSADIKAQVVADSENGLTGKIEIKTGETIDEYSKIIVFVSNGNKVIMRSITFEEAGLEVEENAIKFAAAEGGELTLEFLSNMACEAVIPEDAKDWISVMPSTRVMTEQSITLLIESNNGELRKSEIMVESTDGSLCVSYTIIQEASQSYQHSNERDALIAIYNALGGDNWTNNENWCTDKPVEDWYGIQVDASGNIVSIDLCGNNLKGNIPKEIGVFSKLTYLNFQANNNITSLPDEIAELHSLEQLYLDSQLCPWNPNIYKLSNLRIINMTYADLSQIGQLNNIEEVSIIYPSGNIPSNIDNCRNLQVLRLSSGNLDCAIPSSIGNCSNLKHLEIIYSNLEGPIPAELGNCSELTTIQLNDNNLSGEIPSTLGNLNNLNYLFLESNNLSGTIPVELRNCPLRYLILYDNNLSGDIPIGIQNNEFLWKYCWAYILRGNNFNFTNLNIDAPLFEVTDINNKSINSAEVYSKNKYTLLHQSSLYFSKHDDIEKLKQIYSDFHSLGFEVISYSGRIDLPGPDSIDSYKQFVEEQSIPWSVVCWTEDNPIVEMFTDWSYSIYYPFHSYPAYTLVDSNGKVVMYNFDHNIKSIESFLTNALKGSMYYTSSDYSQDRAVSVLQEATVGNGIDIVLMGDAYSDRLIADGTYRSVMVNTMEQFFSEEPYKSFRDYFNVYMVNVVSPNEVYEDGSMTALSTWFGDGAVVGGNDQKVFDYALNAIPSDRMDEAMVVVMMNRDYYAGTCYMYYPESGDYGNGTSIAYFPTNSNAATFRGLILHEAGGHGFAKLADEYAYEEYGQIPQEVVAECQDLWSFGWYKNVDFTSDLSKVGWSRFIADKKYQYEGLGAFEGGYTYWTGVWRPTETSMMRYNEGGFNAPSREAIYIRINKLAYGDDWQYDYDDFVAYDAVNRKSAASHTYISRKYEPTAPPVIISKTWHEAME